MKFSQAIKKINGNFYSREGTGSKGTSSPKETNKIRSSSSNEKLTSPPKFLSIKRIGQIDANVRKVTVREKDLWGEAVDLKTGDKRGSKHAKRKKEGTPTNESIGGPFDAREGKRNISPNQRSSSGNLRKNT